jgi:hypothetical protein
VLPYANLVAILPTLPRTALPGPWYRAVAFDYLQGPPPGAPAGSPIQPLWPGGCHQKGVRFTPKAPPDAAINGLYLATDEMTTIAEVTGVLRPSGSPVAIVFKPLVLMSVLGVLTNLLDTTDSAVQAALGTNQQELTGNWAQAQAKYLAGAGPMPPTQILGQATFDAGGILGLIYESTKSSTNGKGILVFTDRLAAAGSYVELYNEPGGKLQQRLP